MAKNLTLAQILALLPQIWDPTFFSWILPLLEVRHWCKLSFYAISSKTNEPNLRKCQKTLFQAQIWAPQKKFLWFLPLLKVEHCCKLSMYINLRKINEANLRK